MTGSARDCLSPRWTLRREPTGISYKGGGLEGVGRGGAGRLTDLVPGRGRIRSKTVQKLMLIFNAKLILFGVPKRPQNGAKTKPKDLNETHEALECMKQA